VRGFGKFRWRPGEEERSCCLRSDQSRGGCSIHLQHGVAVNTYTHLAILGGLAAILLWSTGLRAGVHRGAFWFPWLLALAHVYAKQSWLVTAIMIERNCFVSFAEFSLQRHIDFSLYVIQWLYSWMIFLWKYSTISFSKKKIYIAR